MRGEQESYLFTMAYKTLLVHASKLAKQLGCPAADPAEIVNDCIIRAIDDAGGNDRFLLWMASEGTLLTDVEWRLYSRIREQKRQPSEDLARRKRVELRKAKDQKRKEDREYSKSVCDAAFESLKDPIDKKIFELMRKTGRVSSEELGKASGLGRNVAARSKTTIFKAIERLLIEVGP